MDRILRNYPVFLPYSVPFSGKKGVLDAVRHGKLGMVRHLHEIGNPLNVDMVQSAAGRGHVHIVRYLYQMGQKGTSDTLFMALYNGHIEVVKYLWGTGLRCSYTTPMDYAAGHGRLDMVQYFYSIGEECSPNGMDWAMINQHLEVIKYLDSLGVKSEITDRLEWARKYSPKLVPYFQSLNEKRNLSRRIV